MKQYILKEHEDGSVTTIKDVQVELLKIVLEFDRICKKHNIDYALAYGSELGAVRHGGFIPWDDDIDLFMERDDYMRFINIVDEELDSKYYVECFEKDDRYNPLTPNMKIKRHHSYIKEKTLLTNRLGGNGLFIDVFLFEGISESKWKHHVAQAYSMLLMPLIIGLDLLHMDSRFITRRVYNHTKRYAKKHENSSVGSIGVNWTFDGFKYSPIKRSHIFPSKAVNFEGHMLQGSQHPEFVLTYLYGENYMTPPPEDNQIPHHIIDIKIEK
ncbi:MAG: LicD family protein [Erysipelothrix sp.]|nr:LicD family protein [Erysipelothrix sp.]